MGLLGLGIHGYMLADEVRNVALAKAIKCSVSPGDVVVDVGGGTGLLSVLAAKAGASRVYCIEASTLSALAKLVVKDNDLDCRVKVIANLAQATELPERCDLVVSETLGFLAFDEGFRSTMTYARDHFLKTNGRLLPQSIALKAAAVEKSESLPNVWSTPGVDEVNLCRVVRTFSMIPRRSHVDISLEITEAKTLVDLHCKSMVSHGALEFLCYLRCRRSCDLGGLIIWFEAELFDGVRLSSRSPNPNNHWGQAFLAVPDIESVSAGDVLELKGTITDEPGKFSIKWTVQKEAANRMEHAI